MKYEIKKLILSVLFIAIIVLGLLVYKKKHPVETIAVSQNTSNAKIDTTTFSDDEVKLLHPPVPGAPTADVDAHSKLAAKLSVVGTIVDIADCKANPLVLRSSLGSGIIFKNSGKTDVKVSFDGTNMTKISSGASVDMKKDFIHGSGLYGYVCEKPDFKGLIGFVILTQ